MLRIEGRKLRRGRKSTVGRQGKTVKRRALRREGQGGKKVERGKAGSAVRDRSSVPDRAGAMPIRSNLRGQPDHGCPGLTGGRSGSQAVCRHSTRRVTSSPGTARFGKLRPARLTYRFTTTWTPAAILAEPVLSGPPSRCNTRQRRMAHFTGYECHPTPVRTTSEHLKPASVYGTKGSQAIRARARVKRCT